MGQVVANLIAGAAVILSVLTFAADGLGPYFTAEDTLAEVVEALANNFLVLIEEWLAIGPVPGIKEIGREATRPEGI
jgi:hypothetical protein